MTCQVPIRNPLLNPEVGDVVMANGEQREVVRVEHHGSHRIVHARINDFEKIKTFSLQAWRSYAGESSVLVNVSILDAF